MTPPRRRRSAGYTLIEMVVVMAVIGAASTAAVGLIRIAMTADDRLDASYADHRAVESFAEAFRADVRGRPPAEIAIGGDGATLRLDSPGRPLVTYTATPIGVERIERLSADGADESVRRELFDLPAWVTAVFGRDDAARLVGVEFVSDPDARPEERSRWVGTEIVAATRRGGTR